MQRFYIPNFTKQEIFILNDKDAPRAFPTGHIFHQLTKVLRVREWEKIIFFDWVKNLDFTYEIIEIAKKEIKLIFIEEIEKNSELDFELNLFQAMPNKLEKIEYILQKWVEIWYKKFVFYRSERSQKLVISEKKLNRLYKIMVEALEQSWRNLIPTFNLEAEDFKWKFLSNFEWDDYMEVWKEAIFLHTENWKSQKINKYIENLSKNSIKKQNIYVWPEWGFSGKEIEYFEKNNFTRIHLWNRILRTETAWIVVGFTLWQMIN